MIRVAFPGLLVVLAGLLATCSAPPAPEPAPTASTTAAATPADSSRHCGAMPCRSNGVPYVTDKGAIVIYPGESFAIVFENEDGKLTNAQPVPAGGSRSDVVEVSFNQIDSGMMLTVANNLSKLVGYDATMKTPDDRMVYTSSCPVDAGLSNFEHWPHPIKFLELSNFRFQDEKSCK
jgi:hypothetical protein